MDLRECVAIGQFLRPRSEEQICHLCLTAFAPDQLHPDQHRCLLISHVRAKWPALPPSFQRWAEEARGAGDVGWRCARLHFLQAGSYSVADGTVVARHVVPYADGKTLDVPVIYGEHVRDWWLSGDSKLDLGHAKVAWTGTIPRGHQIRLFVDTGENPRPQLELVGLDLVSARTKCATFIIAITAEPQATALPVREIPQNPRPFFRRFL